MPEGYEKTAHEDVARFVVSAPPDTVQRLVEGRLAETGYKPLALRGRSHLLPRVNWDSPWNPPPEFRCFSLIGIEAPWTVLTDELDLVDWDLATGLAAARTVWVLRGWQALDEFEWLATTASGGWQVSSGPTLSEQSHRLLQLSYDEMLLKADPSAVTFLGFTRGRPFAPGG